MTSRLIILTCADDVSLPFPQSRCLRCCFLQSLICGKKCSFLRKKKRRIVLIVQCSLTLAKPTETVSRDSSCALIFNHFSFAFPKDFLPLSKQCERGHDVIGPQRARRTQVEPFPRQYPAQIARHAATGSACRAANAGRRCPGACLPYSDDFLRELMCLYAFVTVSAAI